MLRHSTAGLVTSFLLAAVACAQAKFSNGTHEDNRLGFKVKVPEKWTSLPVDSDEKWVVGKYLDPNERQGKTSDKPYRATMRIVSFPILRTAAETTAGAKAGGAAAEEDDTKRIATFRSYKEWFAKDIKSLGLGFVVESEKPDNLGDVPVTKMEIMTTLTGEKMLKYTCWIYQRKTDGSTIAVEFSQLNDYFKADVDEFERAFKTFKFSTPSGGVDAAVPEKEKKEPLWITDRTKWKAMPKAERQKVREQLETERRKRNATPPAGWEVVATKRFTAISHANPKYTQLILDVAEATWDWMDKRFSDVSDDYVMAGTVRICRDKGEYDSFLTGTAEGDSFNVKTGEVVAFKDEDQGSGGGGQVDLIRGLTNNYLYEKDPYAASFAPFWVRVGLGQYLSSAELDGKRLAFKSANWEKAQIRDALRDKATRSMFELISITGDAFPQEREAANRIGAQFGALVRFLESKEAERIKPLARFLPRYMSATIKAGEQWKKANEGKETAAKTEAEEEERTKNRAKREAEIQKSVLDAVNKDVASFSQKDWQTIEAAWKAWLSK